MFALLAAVLASVASSSITAAMVPSGTCTGAAANPHVYNFEIDGNPAKILNDLSIPVPLDMSFFLADVEVQKRALRRRFEDDSVIFLYNNILYIELDGEGVLFDSGNGPVEDDFGQGKLFKLLADEGISRDSIKHILLTHGHPDHIKGVVEDLDELVPAFPNAVIHISRTEYEYWTADQVDNGTTLLPPEFLSSNIIVAQTVLGAVEDQLQLFEIDEEPLPGIMPMLTPWHTPGSVAYAITDGNDTVVFTGDGLAHKVFSIENPWFTFLADIAPESGAPGRYELLDNAVKQRWQLLCGHATFPGLLFLEHQGVNYQATAANYQGSPQAMSVCET